MTNGRRTTVQTYYLVCTAWLHSTGWSDMATYVV